MSRRFVKTLKNRKPLFIYSLVILFLFTGLAVGQFRRSPSKIEENLPPVYEVPKDQPDLSGKFTFARVRFDVGQQWMGRPFGDHGHPWSHDYPDAGRHLMKIMAELSKTDITLDTNEVIYSFGEPGLYKYPFAYLCEVGYMWNLSDEEIKGMREYCLRGGFLLIDDFRSPGWNSRRCIGPGDPRDITPFGNAIKRAFPEFELKKLDLSHPIFNCFFSIKTLEVQPPYACTTPTFWGLEDETGRLMMIVNFDNDVSDWWQWSNDPQQPIDKTNDAYKFGVDYIMYALTH